jgi:hypothetical protein
VAVVFALTACKTTADRYDLYAPDRPHGPATDKLRGMTLLGRYNHQSTTYTYPASETALLPPPPPPPPEGGPTPPPAGTETGVPVNGTPEMNVGAPAATPMPGVAPVAPLPGTTTPTTPPPAGADQQAIPGLNTPATTTPGPAAAPANSPAPAIPGLSQ